MSQIESAEAPNEAVIPLQREVQRKYGRNPLALERYELLVKSLFAEQDVTGPIGEMHGVRVGASRRGLQVNIGPGGRVN